MDSLSPIQLERHFFTKVQVVSHPQAKVEDDLGINIQYKTSPHKEDPTRFQVVLRVSSIKQEGKFPPYEIEVEIHGYFFVHPSCPVDKRNALVNVNGSGMLFGAAREMVANITARGPHPMQVLATARFYPAETTTAAITDQK